MKIKKFIVPFLLLVLVLAIVWIASFFMNMDTFGKRTQAPSPALIAQHKTQKATELGLYVKIPNGVGTDKVAEILNNLGVIDNPFFFKMISRFKGHDGSYKSGTFFIEWKMSYNEMMKVLTSNPALVKVMIPEYMNIYQLAQKLEQASLVKADEFIRFSNTVKCDYAFAKYIPATRNPRYEGYLFPATYEFQKNASMKIIVDQLLDTFNDRFTPDMYKKAAALNLTTDQVVTLASIVEREAANKSEFRRIAGVFMNRIKINMRLQSDATINYYLDTLKDKSVVSGVKFTDIETPYNTYKYIGLTPGPICSPSKLAIEGVLNYEKHEYMFFLAKGDGTTVFTKNYAEHVQAVAKYLH